MNFRELQWRNPPIVNLAGRVGDHGCFDRKHADVLIDEILFPATGMIDMNRFALPRHSQTAVKLLRPLYSIAKFNAVTVSEARLSQTGV